MSPTPTSAAPAASKPSSAAELLAAPVTLPCGRIVPNRLIKAPMAELQAPFGGGPPPKKTLDLYRAWAKGGWGMIITGNIDIDTTHLGTPFDVCLERTLSSEDMDRFREYAAACKGVGAGAGAGVASSSAFAAAHRPLAVVQLVHAGRQSARGFGRAPWKPSMAPSAVPMSTATGSLPGPLASAFDWALWGSCRAMTLAEIHHLVQRFADSAHVCYDAGFDGVELHASHGYMLAAFLSPKTNQRQDAYGGSAENRFRIIREIVAEIRARVPKEFIVGIKLNSADYVHGGLTEDDALLNVKWLAEMGTVDFAEISGGNYENPSFMSQHFNADEEMSKVAAPATSRSPPAPAPVKQSTRKREAFFAGFANRAASVLPRASESEGAARPRMALCLTGGLRSREGCANAVESAHVDLCGLARASALDPTLPLKFTDPSLGDGDGDGSDGGKPPATATTAVPYPRMAEQPPLLLRALPLKLMGAGWTTLYHVLQMARIVQGLQPDAEAGTWALLRQWVRPAGR